jgi:hypothetical protein
MRFGPAASARLDIKAKYLTMSPELRWSMSLSGMLGR